MKTKILKRRLEEHKKELSPNLSDNKCNSLKRHIRVKGDKYYHQYSSLMPSSFKNNLEQKLINNRTKHLKSLFKVFLIKRTSISHKT